MLEKTSQAYAHHKAALILGPLNKMIEAVFDLFIPLVMKAVLDLSFGTSRDVITDSVGSIIRAFGTWVPDNPTLNYSLIGGVMIIILSVVGFGATMLTQYIAARTAVAVGTEVRDSLYEKILKMAAKDRAHFGNSKLLTILNSDSYQVQQGVLIFIRLIVRAPFVILGALVISFVLDWQIGLIFTAMIPLILVVIFAVMGKASKEYLKIQTKLDRLSDEASDTLEGVKVIKAFHREEFENARFADATSSYEKASIRVQKLNALINPLTFGIIALATLATVLVGGFDLSNGTEFMGAPLLPSTIITEISYLTQIFTTLVQLTNVVMILTKANVSRRRVDEVLTYPLTLTDGKANEKKTDTDVLFDFEHVYLGYKEEGNEALKDISFTLKKGGTLGVIGGTGSGKSTLIYLMERFYEASKGEILFSGKPIEETSLEELRNAIGYVPQKAVLFKGTIRSNFLMADPSATDERMVQALKDSCAYEFVSKYPDFLDHEVEEGGKNFSGGQRQRLTIARALIKDHPVLILDDSTSALDLLTDKTVRTNLAEHYPSVAKVIVSQRVSTVADADEILVLDGGKLIGKGMHEELLKTCPVYKETYLSQVRKED